MNEKNLQSLNCVRISTCIYLMEQSRSLNVNAKFKTGRRKIICSCYVNRHCAFVTKTNYRAFYKRICNNSWGNKSFGTLLFAFTYAIWESDYLAQVQCAYCTVSFIFKSTCFLCFNVLSMTRKCIYTWKR